MRIEELTSKLNGLKVMHKVNGIGEIVEIDLDGDMMKVQFENTSSTFVFPAAFSGFLEAVDADVQQAIIEYIEEKKEEERVRRENEANLAQKQARRANIVRRFPAGYDTSHYIFDPILTYRDIERAFGVNIMQGGIQKASDNSVVLISSIGNDNGNFTYHDKWEGDEYIYSGRGQVGNQTMDAYNSRIRDAKKNGASIHLVLSIPSGQANRKEYYYQGIFEYVDHREEIENDIEGNPRTEIKFILKRVTKNSALFGSNP